MGTGLILSSSNVSAYIGQSAGVLTSCYLKPVEAEEKIRVCLFRGETDNGSH